MVRRRKNRPTTAVLEQTGKHQRIDLHLRNIKHKSAVHLLLFRDMYLTYEGLLACHLDELPEKCVPSDLLPGPGIRE